MHISICVLQLPFGESIMPKVLRAVDASSRFTVLTSFVRGSLNKMVPGFLNNG